MKNIKTIFVLLFLTICISSCSNDDDNKISKEYPESMIYQWDGYVYQTDLPFGQTTPLKWFIKSNGVLEVYNFDNVDELIVGNWYMNDNIFYCTYTINSITYNYELIKNTALIMTGFRGINNETSGAGQVEMFVV